MISIPDGSVYLWGQFGLFLNQFCMGDFIFEVTHSAAFVDIMTDSNIVGHEEAVRIMEQSIGACGVELLKKGGHGKGCGKLGQVAVTPGCLRIVRDQKKPDEFEAFWILI